MHMRPGPQNCVHNNCEATSVCREARQIFWGINKIAIARLDPEYADFCAACNEAFHVAWVTRRDDGAIEHKSRSDNESVDGIS